VGGNPDGVMHAAAVEVLCDRSLAHVVDMVTWSTGGAIFAANSEGAAQMHGPGSFEILQGRNPIAGEDQLAFTPLEAETADPRPPNARNVYPLAYERLASLFAASAAPDIAVVHTGAHYWPGQGGHLGEHGSLGLVQSRAPLLFSGAGVRERGLLERAARVIDVGPTLCWLAGAPAEAVGTMEGSALVDLFEREASRRVVGMLWDGCNSNVLYDMAGRGELPNVARLLDGGCALLGGALAEFPSVTLVNHTSALTGVGPGSHGIVNNAYFDRRSAAQVLTNNAATWHRWSEWLSPGIHTVFELIEAPTASVNEPVDSGADYSTFQLVRSRSSGGGASSMGSMLPDPRTDTHATVEMVEADQDYAWSTAVDAIGLSQVLELWESKRDAPRLMWWNTVLTDTGHHAGGPYSDAAKSSMRDADSRLGVFLERLEDIGLLESTTILLTSDHGSQEADPDCLGDWDSALAEAGIEFRDEAYGFVYLGEKPDS
jgi:phosphonoacetate hydrolase